MGKSRAANPERSPAAQGPDRSCSCDRSTAQNTATLPPGLAASSGGGLGGALNLDLLAQRVDRVAAVAAEAQDHADKLALELATLKEEIEQWKEETEQLKAANHAFTESVSASASTASGELVGECYNIQFFKSKST